MPDDALCKAKVGLLFLQDCGGAAIAKCAACSRAVCRQHRVDSLTGSGHLCPECAAQKQTGKKDPMAAGLVDEKAAQKAGLTEEDSTTPSSVQRVFRRTRYYDDYGYRPYYTGYHHFYSDRDYRTFDDRQPEVVEPVAGVEADIVDMQEAMES